MHTVQGAYPSLPAQSMGVPAERAYGVGMEDVSYLDGVMLWDVGNQDGREFDVQGTISGSAVVPIKCEGTRKGRERD